MNLKPAKPLKTRFDYANQYFIRSVENEKVFLHVKGSGFEEKQTHEKAAIFTKENADLLVKHLRKAGGYFQAVPFFDVVDISTIPKKVS